MKQYIAIHDKNKGAVMPMDSLNKEYCEKINREGYGIFATVNEFEATPAQMKEAGVKTKRNNQFCSKINGVYADLDIAKSGDGSEEEDRERQKADLIKVLNDKCPPNKIIITKNGLQPIWYLTDTSPEHADRARNVINGIIDWSTLFGSAGDAVKDVARVLRCPGYYHMKSDPYMVTMTNQHEEKFSYKELEELFPYTAPEPYIQKDSSYEPSEIDTIDFATIIVRAFSSVGRRASFDKTKRLWLDGKVTGTHMGKTGDGNFLASNSHEPFVGNRITATAMILNTDNVGAAKWIISEFNLDREKIKPQKTVTPEEITEAVETSKKRDVLAQFRQKQEKNNLTWGVESVDRIFHKPEPSNYILFLGTPGVGKTSYCLFMALQNAKKGIKTLFISLEMAKEAIEERYIEIYAGITEKDRISATYNFHQETKMKECKRELEHENFAIIDSSDIGARLDIEILEQFTKDFDLIFVDNLSFMTERTESFFVAQAQVSNDVSLLVDKTRAAIVVLHHMKKDRESMAGSQKLEDDCNIRMDLYQEKDEDDPTRMLLTVRKNRRRNKGTASIFFRDAKYIGTDGETGAEDTFTTMFD